ncbi:hypothetical protein [Nocardia sp. NPDC046763]|uniref:hypothetical protein n=1 Tax=Nocardia sp. NPDC046763 TaxID=3155256 RepID=UPI0033E00A91
MSDLSEADVRRIVREEIAAERERALAEADEEMREAIGHLVEHSVLQDADVRTALGVPPLRVWHEDTSSCQLAVLRTAVEILFARVDRLTASIDGGLGLELGDDAQQSEQQYLTGNLVAPVEEQVLGEALDLLCAHGLLRKGDVGEPVRSSHESSPSVDGTSAPTVGERPVAGVDDAPATGNGVIA